MFNPLALATYAALPLFVVIFAALILGVLIGGVAAWLRQGKWRRAVRKLETETRELHGELDGIRRRFGTPEQAALPARAEPPPPLVMPPPVA